MSDYDIGRLIVDIELGDEASMTKASKFLKDLPDRLERARQNAIKEIEDKVVQRLLRELGDMGLAGSSIAASIVIDRLPDGMVITIGAEHAMYVEFGTGIKGENSPHPNPSFNGQDWEYDMNGHGEKGWYYPTTADDPNPTKYYSKSSDQWWAWTSGQEARPFMYNTWRYARLIITKIFNKHLKRELAR